jgi:hypothetical protein
VFKFRKYWDPIAGRPFVPGQGMCSLRKMFMEEEVCKQSQYNYISQTTDEIPTLTTSRNYSLFPTSLCPPDTFNFLQRIYS